MTPLLLAVLVVATFAAACWWRAYTLIRYDRERERQEREYRAPCGEPIRFPSSTDRGPKAA